MSKLLMYRLYRALLYSPACNPPAPQRFSSHSTGGSSLAWPLQQTLKLGGLAPELVLEEREGLPDKQLQAGGLRFLVVLGFQKVGTGLSYVVLGVLA